ncbi:MAG: hypothetical protein WDO18_20635 [Acidobacteriota bacterium]
MKREVACDAIDQRFDAGDFLIGDAEHDRIEDLRIGLIQHDVGSGDLLLEVDVVLAEVTLLRGGLPQAFAELQILRIFREPDVRREGQRRWIVSGRWRPRIS